MKTLEQLSAEVRNCRICEAHLPLGPRPVFVVRLDARILIVGQAPGTKVHETGVPWNDPSGDTLRSWLGVDRETFYSHPALAILPAGFCYPGRGKGGDLPPRPECAPTWHEPLRAHMPAIEIILAIGAYAHALYVPQRSKSLTETVQRYAELVEQDHVFPLPHPSPRNRKWIRERPWFEEEVVPALQEVVRPYLPR